MVATASDDRVGDSIDSAGEPDLCGLPLCLVGKPLATKSHHMHFKIQKRAYPHFIEFFIKVAPLVVGYESESRTLALKIKDFREGDVPTSRLEVIIEQRSEYRPWCWYPSKHMRPIIPEVLTWLFLKRILQSMGRKPCSYGLAWFYL
ncbi:hypothetical protein OIU77_021681 [Salix suchowensis]|uniref:Uncharacterized protein n=1 Tax=Salix suchowensis TaxID=1278906 RepID=A0ABQ9CE25_9ROSI|nr:hypothetical protein OIU77_021681 [Salix suchowensis]